MNKKIEKTVGESLVYETSLLFVPELDSESLSQTINSIKEKIESLEGAFISEGEPVYIKLAYQVQKSINNKIKKVDFAHFYWIKFDLSSEKVAEFEKFIKLNLIETVMRYLLIKTVRQNTVLTKLQEAKNSKADDELIEEISNLEIKEEDNKDAITDLGDDAVIANVEEIKEA
jgi:ribosomal protein S6